MPELFQEMLLSVSHHNANRYHTQPALQQYSNAALRMTQDCVGNISRSV